MMVYRVDAYFPLGKKGALKNFCSSKRGGGLKNFCTEFFFVSGHLLQVFVNSPKVSWFYSQILRGDTRLPIPPRTMALLAMGLKLGIFGFLPTTLTRKSKGKTNAVTIFARRAGVFVIVFTLSLQYMHLTYAPDENDYFITRKTRRPPI